MCTNYNDYGGIVLGQFYCPIEGFSRTETACCGISGDQYCCYPTIIESGTAPLNPTIIESETATFNPTRHKSSWFAFSISGFLIFMVFIPFGLIVLIVISTTISNCRKHSRSYKSMVKI